MDPDDKRDIENADHLIREAEHRETHALQRMDPMPLSHATSEAAPSVAGMLQAVIDKGVTGENVHAMEKLVELYEKMDARDAKHAFAAAFNALQADMPKIQKTRPVPDRDGNLKYMFAPYEDIMEQVSPLLLKHGFSVSFTSRTETDGRMTKICTLTHRRGHEKSSEFTVRVGKGPPGANESQSDGAAATYAKRFALCDALNIVCEQDTDGADPHSEGDLSKKITADQAHNLQERLKKCGGSEEKFLAFAGVATFAEIPAGKYAMLDANLKRKEAEKK